MKNQSIISKILFFIFLLFVPALIQAQVNVAFKVDMSNAGITFDKVYIVGDLNEWVHTEMTLEGENVYVTTLSLTEGTEPIYYYCIATDWAAANRETVPEECSNSLTRSTGDGWAGDRLIVVPSSSTIVEEIYGACSVSTDILQEDSYSNGNVRAVQGGIEVDCNRSSKIVVVSIDGTIVANEIAEGRAIISCKRGMYIVSINGESKKVLVTN